MSLDILYLACSRREFTRVSLQSLVEHTNWSLVDKFIIYDDEAYGGTSIDIINDYAYHLQKHVIYHALNSPVKVMQHYLTHFKCADIFAKIDNDLVVCPQWLEVCTHVMSVYPSLDFLGINPQEGSEPVGGSPYARRCDISPADHIGGIGLYKSSAFYGRELKAEGVRHGLDTFQEAYPEVTRAWLNPPLPVFLLDYLPFEPWKSLSTKYEAEGLQRPRYWPYYNSSREKLWNWMYPDWSKSCQ